VKAVTVKNSEVQVKRVLLLTSVLAMLIVGTVPAFAQEQLAQGAETSDEGGGEGLWGLAGLAGLAGLLNRKRDTGGRGGASRTMLGVLAVTAVLLVGSSSGVLAQTETDTEGPVDTVQETADAGGEGLDGRWGLLGLLGLFGLFGYRNDRDDRDAGINRTGHDATRR